MKQKDIIKIPFETNPLSSEVVCDTIYDLIYDEIEIELDYLEVIAFFTIVDCLEKPYDKIL